MATEQEAAGQGNAPSAARSIHNGEDKDPMQEFMNEMQQYVSEGVETVQRIAGEYSRKLTEISGEAAGQANKAYEEGQQYVRQHPTETLLGAFAFGVVLGFLLRRS